ncbi:PREDICTED: uncharacterized protein LOC109174252 [Ipomoea nil]|uniref:uncharacterized protein LOC109174252 n=1 Tax=Ipomoea nil TaxID=35883 RepID=UPI000900DF83|nr:PREDICTED: uncharacterized protein LOC109174252 [Ipomoea nil]
MAKMITQRMKPLMEGIISGSQSAFIPDRLITDNILVAAEVGHYLNRKQCEAVDDILLFFRANVQEASEIKNCLMLYESLSGQKVNYHKSSICYSRNTGQYDKDMVAQILGVTQAPNFGKYLGLPSFVGRNKKAAFAYIEDKIKQRIGSWNKRLLSQAGKEILLKSVAQAMPTFSMSVFMLPISICTAIERVMNRYWWGSSTDRGIH